MMSPRLRVGAAAALAVLLAAVSPVSAQTFTWTGTTNTNWSVASNWAPAGGPPNAAGRTALFNGTGVTSVTVDGTFRVGTVAVNLPTSGAGIGISPATGTSKLILDNGASAAVIDLQSATAGISTGLSVPLEIQGNNALNLNSANGFLLNLPGDITGTNSTVTINAADPGTRVRLSGANAYGGTTVVTSGILTANDGGGLPAASALVLSGGVLEVDSAAPSTFTRSLGSGAGQVRLVGSVAGFGTSSGDLNVRLNNGAAAVTWGSADFDPVRLVLGTAGGGTGSVTFENGIDLGGFARSVRVDGPVAGQFGLPPADYRITGAVTGAGSSGIIKEGLGTLTLTGPNTYSGPTTVTAGAVRANDGQGLPAGSQLVLNGGVLESIGTAILSRAVGTGAGQVAFGTGGGGFAARGGTLTVQFPGGTPVWGAGAFVPDGAALTFGTAASDGLVNVLSGIDLGGQTRTISVVPGAAATARARVAGVVSNGGLNVVGGGSLELAGANTYSGPTTVTGGVLRANDGQGLPAGSALTLDGAVLEGVGAGTFNRTIGPAGGQVLFGANGGGFAASGGTLAVTLNGVAAPVTWGSSGFVPLSAPLLFGSGTADAVVDFQNPLRLASGDRRVDVADNPLVSTDRARISGQVSSGGLLKTGPGTLELAATNNNYTGATSVLAGAIRAVDGQGLPTGSNLILSGGVFEGSGTFTRSLGTGAGQVRWGAAGGGFSAAGGTLAVNLGGQATPQQVTWGSGGFVTSGSLAFGSATADSVVDFRNPIDLNFGSRSITVLATPGQPGAFARISGVIGGGGGYFKSGPGTLEVTAENTYFGGGTHVQEGRLLVNNPGGAGTIGVSSGTGIGPVDVSAGATLGGSGRIELQNSTGFFASGSRLVPGGGADNSLRIDVNGSAGSAIFDGTWVVRVTAPGTGGVAANSGGSTVGAAPDPSNHNFLDLHTFTGTPNPVTGAFDFTNTTWEVDGTGVTFVSGQRYSYKIGQVSAAAELFNGPLNVTDQSRFTAVGFQATDFSLVSNGTDIILTFTPVPEPASLVVIGAAGLGLVVIRRRKKTSPTAATATTAAGSGTGAVWTCQARA